MVTEGTAVQSYALATRLLTMLAEPIQLPGVTAHLSASIGMTDLRAPPTATMSCAGPTLPCAGPSSRAEARSSGTDAAVEKAILRR